MSSHAHYLSQSRFDSLDGLRAISIIAVIWHHTAPAWVGITLGHAGAQGVTLFFAISGFLITTLLLRERERNGVIDLKSFYVRRVLRIFPLYYGALAVYIVAVTLLEKHSPVGQAFFGNLIYFATYTSNLFVPLDGRVIFYFAWSLATEEQFYLIWPTVLYITLSRAYIPLCLTLFACIASGLSGSQFLSAVPVAIVASALLAIALHTPKGFHYLEMILGRTWSLALLVLMLIPALILPAPGFVVHLLFVGIVGSCVLLEKHAITQVLTLKPFAYIGSISYGMYMLHMLCKNISVKLLGAFKLPANGLEVFAVTLLLTIVVASLSFKYYESFFLELKRKHAR